MNSMTAIFSLTNRQVRLASRPVGLPTRANWNFTTEPVTVPGQGGVLVNVHGPAAIPGIWAILSDCSGAVVKIDGLEDSVHDVRAHMQHSSACEIKCAFVRHVCPWSTDIDGSTDDDKRKLRIAHPQGKFPSAESPLQSARQFCMNESLSTEKWPIPL